MERRRQYMPPPYQGNPYPYNYPPQAFQEQGWNQAGVTPYSQFAKPIQNPSMGQYFQGGPNPTGNHPGNSPGFINYFYDENGQMDYGKVINTVSQVANAFQQVTPVVQQINSLINTFRR